MHVLLLAKYQRQLNLFTNALCLGILCFILLIWLQWVLLVACGLLVRSLRSFVLARGLQL